jgi:hypothetical protein
VYSGSGIYENSFSSSITVTVNKANTKTTLAESGTSITATVAAVAPGAGTPSGTVTFVDTNTNKTLGTVSLSGGAAKLSNLSSSIKNHTIKATYNGDGNFNTSNSTIKY